MVQGIEKDPYGIGYSGIGYMTSGVRAVPLSPVEPARRGGVSENAANGSYPLARFLHIYVNKAPNKELDRLTAEYLRFILSAQGQRVVIKAGFDPLDAATAANQLAKIGE